MKALVVLLLLLLSVGPVWAEQRPAQRAPAPRAILRALEDAFTEVADRVTPAVVNVSTVPRRPAGGPHGETPERFREFFGEEFYERYFKQRPRQDARARGSSGTTRRRTSPSSRSRRRARCPWRSSATRTGSASASGRSRSATPSGSTAP